jgi:hypothetical protein
VQIRRDPWRDEQSRDRHRQPEPSCHLPADAALQRHRQRCDERQQREEEGEVIDARIEQQAACGAGQDHGALPRIAVEHAVHRVQRQRHQVGELLLDARVMLDPERRDRERDRRQHRRSAVVGE